jgi:hypothetical protein
MENSQIVIRDFLGNPDKQENIIAMIKLISERRDIFPEVSAHESILDIAKRISVKQ